MMIRSFCALYASESIRLFARCLILRANGELSLLDLDDGRERELTDSVE